MSYKDTFIQVAPDCPATYAIVPVAKGTNKPVHVLQYELLTAHPYTYTHEALVFEVYVRQQGLPPHEVEARRAELWTELFQKGHPCLRASQLTKRYGWGAHYDADGRIALYPLGSPDYERFAQDPTGRVRQLYAMRSKRV